MLEALLTQKPKLDANEVKRNSTALHMAVWNNLLDSARLLLKVRSKSPKYWY